MINEYHLKSTTWNNQNELITLENTNTNRNYFVKISFPDFSILSPINGKPSYANVYINYIPNEKLVELDSLRLYLLNYSNHVDYRESCIVKVLKA